MTEYCKNCGAELEDGSLFCNECGTKSGGPLSSANVNKNSSENPFNRYKIDMIPGEKVIRSSQIHIGCLYLPLVIMVMGLMIGFVNAMAMAYGYVYSPLEAFSLILFNPIFIIGLVWLLVRFIGYTNNDLILTNKRVFGKCRLISTTQMQSPLKKIDSVSFRNGLIGKLIGYGTVEIATTSSHFKFRFIKDGQTFYNDIFNQLEISDEEKRVEDAKAIADAISK